MSLATNVTNLATRVGTEFKTVRTEVTGKVGVLTDLDTTAKTNLVAAINEVNGAVAGASGINDATVGTSTSWSSQKTRDEIDLAVVDPTELIDDVTASTTSVYSSTKTNSQIAAAVSGLVDGAPTALDTLNELAAALGDNASYAATITTALDARVAVSAQTFTGSQQVQARTNIGAASAADLTALDTRVGADSDFSATFVAALA